MFLMLVLMLYTVPRHIAPSVKRRDVHDLA